MQSQRFAGLAGKHAKKTLKVVPCNDVFHHMGLYNSFAGEHQVAKNAEIVYRTVDMQVWKLVNACMSGNGTKKENFECNVYVLEYKK